MALSIKELIERTQEKFHLKLLCGRSVLDYVVTWVHMTEDASVAEFFWGNEIVVTSGYVAQKEGGFKKFIDTLLEKRSAGIVINVGKYISTIPQDIIDYCDEQGLPLITMPWHMSITAFVRECCNIISKSNRDEDDLARAVLHTIHSPGDSGQDQGQLSGYFREELGFQILALRIERPDLLHGMTDQRSALRLHTALRPYDFPYLVFRHHERFFILLNQTERSVGDQIARRVLDTVHETMPELPVCVGVGEPVRSFLKLSDSYHAAVSASRRAALQNLPIVRFRDMGFYKLLYSVADDAILASYYHETMDVLLEHDRKNGSCYVETLFRYLLSDGSLQTVAKAMYTHRNTVNYRMGRIRELLGQELIGQEERLPYLLAYHAGVILKLVEDME